MRIQVSRTAALMLMLTMLVTSCATNQFLVSGKALDEVGQQFLATGKMYDDLFKAKVVTADEYRSWATFANQFKLVYPSVISTWKAAQSGEQAAQSTDAILALKNELLQFYLTALKKKGAK